MKVDLGLQGNNFSDAASAFFIAYLVAEVPNGVFSSLFVNLYVN